MIAGPKSRDWLKRRLSSIMSVRSHSLDNGFSGEECRPIGDYGKTPGPWGWLADDLERFRPSVRVDAAGIVTVRYHSNHWLYVRLRADLEPVRMAPEDVGKLAGDPVRL